MVFCGMQAIARIDMYASVNSGSRQQNTTTKSSANGRLKTSIGIQAISSVLGYCASLELSYNSGIKRLRSSPLE